jgi:hypothetical protein
MMGMGMSGMLLERPDVQRELNLTEQQKTQIRQMQEAMRAAMAGAARLAPAGAAPEDGRAAPEK